MIDQSYIIGYMHINYTRCCGLSINQSLKHWMIRFGLEYIYTIHLYINNKYALQAI